MSAQTEISGRDETLATGLYTGTSQHTIPQQITHFEYTVRTRGLLHEVAATYGQELGQGLSPEHRALVERDEEQSPEDLALAARMGDVQRSVLTS